MPAWDIPQTIAYWQTANERWAKRRCSELSLPYEPLWTPSLHLARPRAATSEEQEEQEEVILQWAGMNRSERVLWGKAYEELNLIPEQMLSQERDRQNRMWGMESARKTCAAIAPDEPMRRDPQEPSEFTLTPASKIPLAAPKKRSKRKAS